jgi:hypothetical protein
MSYIGRQNLGGAYRQLDDISSGFDGSDTTHTMQVNSQNVTVGDVNQIILSLGGVIQNPGTDFTVSGSVLTFTTAPAANTSFFAILLGSDNGGTVTPTDGSVTTSKFESGVAIGATGTANTLAGIPFFSDTTNGSMYTHDVSGTDSTAAGNTAFGFTSMDAITTGDDNTAMGENAMGGLQDGVENVAIGKNSMLAATSASQNTCVGLNSGAALSSGSGYNVLLGHGAGAAMTSGNRNIAIGVSSMDGFDTETHNLGIGISALGGSVAGGEYNVAVGNYTLDALTSADYCTAVGYQAGSTLTTGGYTTAVGYQAMSAGNVTGAYNTAVGVQALNNVTSGANNTCVGYSAGNDSLSSIGTVSNYIVLGNNSNTDFVAKVDVTAGSDRRDKTDIEDLPEAAGLNFVNQLRPVTYVWDNRSNYYPHTHEKYGERDHSKKELRVHPGFISQEVKEIEKSIGWEDDHIVNTENDNSWKLKYSALIPILTKAIQELSEKVKALEDA